MKTKIKKKNWTTLEESVLRRKYPDATITVAEIAAELERTELSVATHAQLMGLVRPRYKVINERLLNRLYHRGMTVDELAEKFGISKWAVKRIIV